MHNFMKHNAIIGRALTIEIMLIKIKYYLSYRYYYLSINYLSYITIKSKHM